MIDARDDDRFDPTLIDEMLALSPVERIARHDKALATVLMLERAGRKRHDSEPRPAPAPRSGRR